MSEIFLPQLTLEDVPDENSGVDKLNQEQFNIDQLRNWGYSMNNAVNDQLSLAETRIQNLLSGVESASEVVDSRDDYFGTVFSNLKERLDFMQYPFIIQLSSIGFNKNNDFFPNLTAFKYNYGAGQPMGSTVSFDPIEQIEVKVKANSSNTIDIYLNKNYLISSPTVSYDPNGKALYLIDQTNNKYIALYQNNSCTFAQVS